MASTEVAIREDKDASPKSKSDSPKSKSEFLLVNSGSGEHVLETRDDTEKAEKLAQDSIAQSQERMKHEHAKQMKWNDMLIKIEAKKQAAIMEDFMAAHNLKLEIDNLNIELNAMDKAWTEKKAAEKAYWEEVEAYEQGKLMRKETLIKISAEQHEGQDVWILLKHNEQVQWEWTARKGAGWSNGNDRSQEDIDEFKKHKAPKINSSNCF